MSIRFHKKSTGTFYTPEPLAKMIAHDAIFAWISEKIGKRVCEISTLQRLKNPKKRELLEEICHITVLDPAVGDGVFLVSAGELLSRVRLELSDDLSEKDRKTMIAKQSLFGVDLARQAIESCIEKISKWGNLPSSKLRNFKTGNSLVGFINEYLDLESSDDLNYELARAMSSRNPQKYLERFEDSHPIHWHFEFPQVFTSANSGFDIILGNPPYGSILGQLERHHISTTYPISVGGSRVGTWNSAAHFLVRAISLMSKNAQLGFLVPNSFLRVKQFTKTRNFLMNHTKLRKVVDEGSPFNDVTLEMVSIFCETLRSPHDYEIEIYSRRPGMEQSNVVSAGVMRESQVFSIYHDHILTQILNRGKRYMLVAGRGRDIPKGHVRKNRTPRFNVPYITSGRSVQRYGLHESHVYYTDDWFKTDAALRHSFENDLLVATKNYRFPRCIIKPSGMIHGGGIVNITPLYENADLPVLGLILNSKLVRHISIRYLTNYSQLTCCLNTGIMEELPLVIPKRPQVYRKLFLKLSQIYSSKEDHPDRQHVQSLETLADGLVYSLYFGDDTLEQRASSKHQDLITTCQEPDIMSSIENVMTHNLVRELESLSTYPASRKIRIY
ncbi:MAG: Eco57I restriction-modification methylase domain-containing protein [Candidatus Thorarchaeota archaeon]